MNIINYVTIYNWNVKDRPESDKYPTIEKMAGVINKALETHFSDLDIDIIGEPGR